jgi:hypothetical protein
MNPIGTALLTTLLAASVSMLNPAAPARPDASPLVFTGQHEYIYDLKATDGGVLELNFDHEALPQTVGYGEEISRIEGILRTGAGDVEGKNRITFTLRRPRNGKTLASFLNVVPGTWRLKLRAYDRDNHLIRIPLSEEQATIQVTAFEAAAREIALDLYEVEVSR